MNANKRCWQCDGTGTLPTTHGPLRCFRCKGTKLVPEQMSEWFEKGRAMREERLSRRVSLREHCRQTGEDLRIRSDKELGIIDPDQP